MSATGGAPHRPPQANRRCVQLVRRLPPRVSGRPATGGTERRGHTAKGTRGQPATRAGVEGRTPQSPPPQAGREGTGPGHGHRPPNQLGPCATGLRPLVAMQLNIRGAEDTPQQRGHDAGEPGADEEMTEASGPQKSSGSPPTAASCPMSPQQEPSTGNVPGGQLDTTPGHPSPTGTTPDQDRETMPPPTPRPPQRRNTDSLTKRN